MLVITAAFVKVTALTLGWFYNSNSDFASNVDSHDVDMDSASVYKNVRGQFSLKLIEFMQWLRHHFKVMILVWFSFICADSMKVLLF